MRRQAAPEEAVAPVFESQREIAMQRVTWVVLGTAFAVWLGLGGAGILWVLSLLQRGTAPAPSTLEGASGVVLYQEADQRSEASARQGLQLFDGDELATSFGSSASLRVFDGSLLQIYPNARLRVVATRIGRFNPSANQAALTLLAGAVRLSVPPASDRRHTLNLATPHGAAEFTSGEYTVRVAADRTRISVWAGRTSVAMDAAVVEVSAGQKIISGSDSVGARTAPLVAGVLENVLGNGDFTDGFRGWELWQEREQGRPDVPGRLEIEAWDGPEAPAQGLRATRNSERDAHNETGLRQRIGRDVSGARVIRLEGQVRVDFASLSGGGYLGSEYPMMIRIRVRDFRGSEQIWTRGFYYANPENRPVPIGQRIERATWVPFSVDLTDVLNEPAAIETIEVFGAGHTFDASIGEVRLLVD